MIPPFPAGMLSSADSVPGQNVLLASLSFANKTLGTMM